MDQRDKKSLPDHEENTEKSENKKCCTDCKTTKTPLWRGGPAGPKSLCNACGIRYRKKRRAMANLEKGPLKKKERSNTNAAAMAENGEEAEISSSNGSGNEELSESLKMSLIVLLQRSSSSIVKKQRCQRRRKLGEEELAAFSLMALSCGSAVSA